MTSQPASELEDDFVSPGLIRISASALQLARDLDYTARRMQGGDCVIVFDWATNVNMRSAPDAQPEPVADCVMIGAYKRHEVPEAAIQSEDGIDIVIQIPKAIWEKAAERLIDTDESLLFKLILR